MADLKTDLKTDDIDKMILSVVADNKDITIPEIAKAIKLSISGTKLRLNKLKTAGILERVGADKGG
ncbi:MAG: winged helix-turn-helix domain-containing protein, partial [Candidatus Symbiothrix sp.]|nr:winged helix-turn-helix domain-containing protein [Candidatus Symbiothrix sp.]